MKRTLPKVYACPRCGVIAVRVARKPDGLLSIACGSCGLSQEMPLEGKREPIDLYNEFVDRFMAGRIGM